MKLEKLIPLVGILLLLSVAPLYAQSSLPNPHDDACWSSLSALRACQLQAYNQAADQEQRCTSYPEYQCLPPEVSLSAKPGKISAKQSAAPVAKSSDGANTSTGDASPAVLSGDYLQSSNSK